MSHSELTAGRAFALVGGTDNALFVLFLTLAALFLFTRWSETADRSAYVVGTLAAITAPGWLIANVLVAFANDPYFLVNDVSGDDPIVLTGVLWVLRVAGLGLLLATLYFALRPLWVTGLFLRAPQGEVRKQFKQIETSWQVVIALVVVGKLVVFVVPEFLGRWW